MFLLMAVRLRVGGGAWYFPLLSLGEWLLLPLGAASLTMGLLALWKVRERTLLPLWMSAVIPACLWLAAMGLNMLARGATQEGGDQFLSWTVHLVFPTLAFLPLLAQPEWRDRLFWALAAGITLNAALVFLQARASGHVPPDTALLDAGGLLAGQYDYALYAALALPLLAAWRGGETKRHRALATMLCTFLLPALALSACFSLPGLAAAGIGLAVAWAAWRSPAWITGVFICLLLFGYGAEQRRQRDENHRRLVAASAAIGMNQYGRAFAIFAESPYFGEGPEAFAAGDRPADDGGAAPHPWYAALLGGGGLIGLGLWLALLAELAVRAVGRYGRRCLLSGGVLGATFGLAAVGLWTNALPEGAGALVGLLLAISALEEVDPEAGNHVRRQAQRKRLRRVTAIIAKVRGDTRMIVRDNPPETPER